MLCFVLFYIELLAFSCFSVVLSTTSFCFAFFLRLVDVEAGEQQRERKERIRQIEGYISLVTMYIHCLCICTFCSEAALYCVCQSALECKASSISRAEFAYGRGSD